MRRNSSFNQESWLLDSSDYRGARYAEYKDGIEKIIQIHEHRGNTEELNYSDITRQHWENTTSKACCSNKKCNKKFALLARSAHCRRCGRVFCKDCVGFKRRLNRLAHPDPDGKIFKVCEACFDKGPQGIGVTRNLWVDFQTVKRKRRSQSEGGCHTQRGWRQRFNMRQECQRLTTGFEDHITNCTDVKRALRDLAGLVTVPDWQKSYCWLQESLSSRCSYCEARFGVLTKRRHCRVCGLAVCWRCSNNDLLVYFPDAAATTEDDGSESRVKLAVIRVVGGPETEPTVCMYLRNCVGCHQKLSDLQVTSHMTSFSTSSHPLLKELVERHEQLMDFRGKIDSHLVDYQTIIDSLDDNSRSGEGKGRCNMKTLAKAQADLSDFFTRYIMAVQHLKQLKPAAGSLTQTKLLSNFIKSACDFYLDNMYLFRMHQRALEGVCDPEVLRLIQTIMDKNAIVSAHIYLRQLAFEALHWTSKHSILPDLPNLLVAVEAVVEREAERCITSEGDDWSQHNHLTQQLVHSQLQHHRLIRPSRKLLKRHGSSHIRDIAVRRTLDCLMQVRLQLAMKTAHKNFKNTKSALLSAFEDVEKQYLQM